MAVLFIAFYLANGFLILLICLQDFQEFLVGIGLTCKTVLYLVDIGDGVVELDRRFAILLLWLKAIIASQVERFAFCYTSCARGCRYFNDVSLLIIYATFDAITRW